MLPLRVLGSKRAGERVAAGDHRRPGSRSPGAPRRATRGRPRSLGRTGARGRSRVGAPSPHQPRRGRRAGRRSRLAERDVRQRRGDPCSDAREPDYVPPDVSAIANATPSPLDQLLDSRTKAKARTAALALFVLAELVVILFLATR